MSYLKQRLKLIVFTLVLFTVYLVIYLENQIKIESSLTIKLPNKRVLYFSAHSGTIDEMIYVFKRRNLNFTVSKYDIFKKYGYAISESLANEIINSGLIEKIFDEYDLIIVGDTTPIGRPFYQASPHICKSKLAIQITNRFNCFVNDKQYLELMQKLVNNTNVFWIPNNDYDLFFLKLHGIHPNLERLMVIRPFGVSNEQPKKTVEKKTIIYAKLCVDLLKIYLKNSNVSDKKYEIHSSPTYGGPLSLKDHNLFVYFPYQFSTMKVFQNANYRILTAIPSPKLYKLMALSDTTHEHYSEIKWLLENVKDWTDYYDVYHPKYIGMYIQFDSWNELVDLINGKNLNSYRAKLSNRIKKIMNLHEHENDEKWDHFFKLVL